MPEKSINWTVIQRQIGSLYYALILDADIVAPNDYQQPAIVSNPKISIFRANSTIVEQTCN